MGLKYGDVVKVEDYHGNTIQGKIIDFIDEFKQYQVIRLLLEPEYQDSTNDWFNDSGTTYYFNTLTDKFTVVLGENQCKNQIMP